MFRTCDADSSLINHYETSPPNSDEMQKSTQEELKAKLEDILQKLEQKKKDLEAQLAEQERLASSVAFDTDDPEMKRHVVCLSLPLKVDD